MISAALLGPGDEFENCPIAFGVQPLFFPGIKAFLHLQFIKHILQPPFLVHFDRFDFGLNLCDKLILIIHVPGYQVKEGAQGAGATVVVALKITLCWPLCAVIKGSVISRSSKR